MISYSKHSVSLSFSSACIPVDSLQLMVQQELKGSTVSCNKYYMYVHVHIHGCMLYMSDVIIVVT